MTKKIKSIKLFAVLLITIILSAALISGCQENQATGEFYTLQEAYDNGLLTHEDLESIAYYHNNGFTQQIDDSISLLIREKAAYDLRNDKKDPIKEAKAEDIFIISYYGVYNSCYAVAIENGYVFEPAIAFDIWDAIDGVQFHFYNKNKIRIWKNS